MNFLQTILLMLVIISVLYIFYRLIRPTIKTKLDKVGIREYIFTYDYQFGDEHHPRPLRTVVYYPVAEDAEAQEVSDPYWVRVNVAINAQVKKKNEKFPLIIMSHGYANDRWGLDWLAEALVASGYLVVSFDHYGNNKSDEMLPEVCLQPWIRPQDVSFVLDKILAHPDWKDLIDSKKIGFAGFSQGGATGLWLAGARTNFKDVMNDLDGGPEGIIGVSVNIMKAFTREDVEEILPIIDYKKANSSFKDPRIKAAFLMAPGFSKSRQMFINFDDIDIPVEIVTGSYDKEVDAEKNAKAMAQGSDLINLSILLGKIGHWVFLNEMKVKAEVEIPWFLDDPSIDRAQVHRKVAKMALDFFHGAGI